MLGKSLITTIQKPISDFFVRLANHSTKSNVTAEKASVLRLKRWLGYAIPKKIVNVAYKWLSRCTQKSQFSIGMVVISSCPSTPYLPLRLQLANPQFFSEYHDPPIVESEIVQPLSPLPGFWYRMTGSRLVKSVRFLLKWPIISCHTYFCENN